ncbi:MAG: hypothetical protein R3191_07680 [Anaerolineales bacterium]|nr:hypothetical protein [Anaerolineales bacterium]
MEQENKEPFNYRERAREGTYGRSGWAPYLLDEAPIPDLAISADRVAVFLFYLGELEKAKEVSLLASRFKEERSNMSRVSTMALETLFEAAIYRSLADKGSEEIDLWRQIVEGVSDHREETILKNRRAHIWVHQAYAHLKLGEYGKVRDPAVRGLEGIDGGHGLFEAPHKNSREYALVPLIIALAEHLQDGTEETREKAQEALQIYKKENTRYGRHGYPVIFDLQFSYPDVFEPVLPSDDPTKD